jgi:hypothetical protein
MLLESCHLGQVFLSTIGCGKPVHQAFEGFSPGGMADGSQQQEP